jgi:hypothetical protein
MLPAATGLQRTQLVLVHENMCSVLPQHQAIMAAQV